jgi:hypothetical protein
MKSKLIHIYTAVSLTWVCELRAIELNWLAPKNQLVGQKIELLPTKEIQLEWIGPTNEAYLIERTKSLRGATWEIMSTHISMSNEFQKTQIPMTSSGEFFRVRALPHAEIAETIEFSLAWSDLLDSIVYDFDSDPGEAVIKYADPRIGLLYTAFGTSGVKYVTATGILSNTAVTRATNVIYIRPGPPDLMGNGHFEKGKDTPLLWKQDDQGGSATFDWAEGGVIGKGAFISKYGDIGKAGWVPDSVAIVEGKTYVYRSMFRQSGHSFVRVEFKMRDGTYVDMDFPDVAATAEDEWQPLLLEFTAPRHARRVTVTQYLTSGLAVSGDYGSLALDEVSLREKQ